MMPSHKYTLSFDIDYPQNKSAKTAWNKEYSLNAYYAGKHWAKRKADADFWHALVHYALCKAKQHGPVTMAESPVSITFLFNDSLDCSNHAAMVKMIEDALKGVVIHDDSPKYVKSITIGFHQEPCIRVIVQSYEK